jgi:hypothetical protein
LPVPAEPADRRRYESKGSAHADLFDVIIQRTIVIFNLLTLSRTGTSSLAIVLDLL